MKCNPLVFFSLIALVASTPSSTASGIIPEGFEPPGDLEFRVPGGRPKQEVTEEPDRMYKGIYIPHTLEWRIPPRKPSQSEDKTDRTPSGADITDDAKEDKAIDSVFVHATKSFRATSTAPLRSWATPKVVRVGDVV